MNNEVEVVVRPTRREDLVTMQLGIAPDPKAKCPLYEKTVGEVFKNRAAMPGYWQRALGYSITGHTTERKMFVCIGTGANGKNTLIDPVVGLLGDYAGTLNARALRPRRAESINDELAGLNRKRLLRVLEFNQGDPLDEGLIKELTDGACVPTRGLYQTKWDKRPFWPKLWLATNYKPKIQGTDDGIWDRIDLIPFHERFEGERQDKDLDAKLKEEWPGILNWLWRGCEEWSRVGLDSPPEVRSATQEYRTESDQVARWKEERLVEAPEKWVSKKDAHADYVFWCQRSGERWLELPDFSASVARLGVRAGEKRHKTVRAFLGVQLASGGADGGPSYGQE